jgi:hypothetical protein
LPSGSGRLEIQAFPGGGSELAYLVLWSKAPKYGTNWKATFKLKENSMRKSILFSLLCLIAVVAVACGGGNNATSGNQTGGGDTAGNGGGDAADAFALYKKEGRKWKHKSVTKMEGMDDMVSFTQYEVIKVGDDAATYKMTTLDAEGKETYTADQEVKFEIPDAPACTGGEAPEVKEETIKVEAGEFECIVTDVSGTKSWTSKKYPGLVVKMEGANMTMELVEFTE